ncbi:hypothetical protein ACQ4M4_21635 [Leptolyngbya sp. AN02str]|uniref:hypothetical protein n=1 Tax=Leptolyngbya sp. AN02str TaxID=3423363 RepID=UPI003D3111B4
MYDLARFTLKDMTECGSTLRKLGQHAQTMEDAANRIVHYFYEQFGNDETGARSLALARLFKTHNYGELTPDLQQFVQTMHQEPNPSMKCLTLMGTAGDRPEWCTRTGSRGHQAIPLIDQHMVSQIPMISQLIHQFGLEIDTVLSPNPAIVMDLEQTTFNVFHVPSALGSPYVPAQDFVETFGIESVLGFGGMMPSGNLMAVILFSKEPISRTTAELFKTLALNVKVALLPFERSLVFA